MLGYIGLGKRMYGDHPTPPTTRELWEFQAVIQGWTSPTLLGNMQPSLCQHTMWVFAPNQPHGWIGKPNETCKVFVVHFDQVPEPLREHIQASGPVTASLGYELAQRLYGKIKEIVPDYEQPNDRSNMRFDKLLLDLSLHAMKDIPLNKSITPERESCHKVAHALSWYAENLANNPSVEDVASVVRISPSHLRRLFHQVKSQSPISMLKNLQTQRAKELMTQTNLSLREISQSCGFSEQSVFSRCFKHRTGLTPRQWRAINRKDQRIEGPGIVEN